MVGVVPGPREPQQLFNELVVAVFLLIQSNHRTLNIDQLQVRYPRRQFALYISRCGNHSRLSQTVLYTVADPLTPGWSAQMMAADDNYLTATKSLLLSARA